MVLAKKDKIKVRRQRIGLFRLVPLTLAAGLLMWPTACDKGRKVDVAASIHPENMPTMTTKNVSTFISDSGIIQYKIVSPLWYIYDRCDTPFWSFPKGVYMQKFDRNYKVIATVAADSARYFQNQRLWRLDGNVELTRVPQDLFLTQQLFWDEQQHIIYSDSFIHIQTPTHMLEGYGFVSDEKIRDYRILRPSGIFPFSQNPMTASPAPSVSASPDINTAPDSLP